MLETRKLIAIARSLTESSTKNCVFRRRLPAKFGRAKFYVTPSAGLKYLFKPMSHIDPILLRLAYFFVKPGDVVWDVGANIGLFSFAAAACCGKDGRVVAFEPDMWLVQILRKSSAIQPSTSSKILVVPAAVASEASLRKFSIAKRSRASNALVGHGQSQMGGIAEEQVVTASNLDWFLTQLPGPNVLKIDVEGAEVEALRNQRCMLDEIRPVIICEVARRNSNQITSILSTSNYVLYDGAQPITSASEVKQAVWSTVAIPEEATNQYLQLGGGVFLGSH